MSALSSHSASPFRTHLIGIDGLRFFAAISVMLFHFGYWCWAHPGTGYVVNDGSVRFPYLAIWTNWGWVGVHIFFVISGFVIALSAENATAYNFLVSRIVRLGPTVWICAPITFAVSQIVHVVPRWQALKGLLHSLLFVPFEPWIDGVYWTLGVEVSFYSLVLALLLARRFDLIKTLAAILGFLSAAFWLMYTVAVMGSGPLFDAAVLLESSRVLDLLLIHHGCEFALGIFLWLEFTKRKSAGQMAWIVALSFASCLNIYADNADKTPLFPAIVPIAIWLGAVALIVRSISPSVRPSRLPSWVYSFCRRIGLMTYPLYLFHQINGVFIMRTAVRFGLPQNAAIAIALIVSIGCSWYISSVLEAPLQRATRRVLLSVRGFAEPVGRKPTADQPGMVTKRDGAMP